MTASSVLGVLGWVSALLVSALVCPSLFRFVNDPSFKWATESVAALAKSEFVIFHGAVKTALWVTGLISDLASLPPLVLLGANLV
jgi:hypothetical protein